MKIYCLAAAMLVAMTPKAAIAAEQAETTASTQVAKACATANEIAAKNDIRTASTERRDRSPPTHTSNPRS
jgi:hypothetical protein